MRYKTVPPAPPDDLGLDALASVRDALPLVPRSEDDCCARLVERIDWIDSRDDANGWIAFLHALGLAEQTNSGYVRVRGDLDPETLQSRFRERILGSAEVCEALESGDPESVTIEDAFEAIEPVVPEWERRRSDAWRAVWRDRAERRLVWATILGLAEHREDSYVHA